MASTASNRVDSIRRSRSRGTRISLDDQVMVQQDNEQNAYYQSIADDDNEQELDPVMRIINSVNR